MRFLILSAVLVAALTVFPYSSLARGLGKLVTKETQKELGLEFELSAIRDEKAVVVMMTIPKSGKLADLRIVRLTILAEDQKNFLVRAPLEMRPIEASTGVSAQLAPELAEKATLELVVQEGRREFFYAVRVADYITKRDDKERK